MGPCCGILHTIIRGVQTVFGGLGHTSGGAVRVTVTRILVAAAPCGGPRGHGSRGGPKPFRRHSQRPLRRRRRICFYSNTRLTNVWCAYKLFVRQYICFIHWKDQISNTAHVHTDCCFRCFLCLMCCAVCVFLFVVFSPCPHRCCHQQELSWWILWGDSRFSANPPQI